MKILCVLTPSHQEIFDKFFFKTVPSPGRVYLKRLNLEGNGKYKSKSWQSAVKAKTDFVVSYLKTVEDNTCFLFSDVDIQFFPSFSLEKIKNELLESKMDILFQKENMWENDITVNSGFYVAKSSKNLLAFFESVLSELDGAVVKSDQACVNSLLADSDIEWGYLSKNYYARTHGFPPPADIFCHHANYASTVYKKINQMKLIQFYLGTNILNRLILGLSLKSINRILRVVGLEKMCL